MKKILLTLIVSISCISLMGMENKKQIIPVTMTPPSFDPPPPYASIKPSTSNASMFEIVQIQNQTSQTNNAVSPQSSTSHAHKKVTGFKKLTTLSKICWSLAIIPAIAIDTGLCPLTKCCDCCRSCSDSCDSQAPIEAPDECTCYFTRSLLRCIDIEKCCGVNTYRRHDERWYNTHNFNLPL